MKPAATLSHNNKKGQSMRHDKHGRFAAGFGRVGLSPVHAAWFNLLIANKGRSQPLRITKDSDATYSSPRRNEVIIDEATSWKIRKLMHKTVVSGTARSIFRKKRYRKIASEVGGKTGTLTSHELKAQIRWFVGLTPYEDPEIIVSSVTVMDGDSNLSGAELAAEGFYQYYQSKAEKEKLRMHSLSSEKTKGL